MALTDNLAELAARLERDTRGSPRTLARRRFLQGALALTAGHILAASRPAAAQVVPPRFTAYPFSLGVASGAPRPDSVVLWTRLAPEPLAQSGDGGMPPERVFVNWEVAEDEQFSRIVQERQEPRGARTGAQRARRGHGPAARPLVLVPLHRRRRVQPRRPHAHGGPAYRPAALRVRVLPAVRAGLFLGVQPYAEGGRRPGRLPRRLHLREFLGQQSGAPPRGTGSDVARAVSRAARAIQDGRRTAGDAPCRAVDRHLGRPRGRQRLRGRPRRVPRPADAAAPRGGLPGLLRAHAGADERPAARRRHAHHRPLFFRRPGRFPSCWTTASTARRRPVRGPAWAAVPLPRIARRASTRP
jgi:hypothetical protein